MTDPPKRARDLWTCGRAGQTSGYSLPQPADQPPDHSNTPEATTPESSRWIRAQTLAEKITYLLDHTYPNQTRPSDSAIAHAISSEGDGRVVTVDQVRPLRVGDIATAEQWVLDRLGAFFSVSPMFFQPDEEVARQVTEGIQFLAALNRGLIVGVAARGGSSGGLSASQVTKINELVDQIRRGKIPGARDDSQT